MVDNTPPIKDFNDFLCRRKTKDSLTLYLAQKMIQNCMTGVTTVTRLGISSNDSGTDIGSNHEEADTLLILYVAEIHKSGTSVHIGPIFFRH